jgi:two-component system sensor histidine kinase PfeS
LLCIGLYRLLVVPLNNLREQANAWRADQLHVRLSSGITQRPDELGELARAFDSMSERLQSTVALQQQLLRDLSHELRTPLSRLRVASESEQDLRNCASASAVKSTACSGWSKTPCNWPGSTPSVRRCPTKRSRFRRCGKCSPKTPVMKAAGRSAVQCSVPASCWVRGNLNTLAQALENMLRNAIRHSPEAALCAWRSA